jgi:hypothetical protein
MHPFIGPLQLGTLFGLALLISAPAQAFCGFFAGKADASLFNEASKVIMARDGNRTVLSLLNDYKGPLNEFALIIPTPVALKQGQVRIAEKLSFDRIDAYSSPRLAEYFDNDPCTFNFQWGEDLSRRPVAPAAATMSAPKAGSAERSKALGVTVEAKYTLEEYDIVSLSAKQSGGLEIWLRENGYKIPKGASAAFKPYINQGMKFFVAKVNLKDQAKTGYTYLRPLQFAFESEKFMLPIRLGMINAAPDKPQDLIIYMLTRNGRVESSNYRTVKLPTNLNLPPFIKPKFADFYKAMFESAATKEDYRVVFTEYFWDMSWCDPCADNPLSPQELRNAGVFWVNGNADEGFAQMLGGPTTSPPVANIPKQTSNSQTSPTQSIPAPRPIMSRPMPGRDARPAMVTRMHVRYTPSSFPEDLMFTQTQDRQNWQTRYVIQNPYAGSSEQCNSKLSGNSCDTYCTNRVKALVGDHSNWQTAPGPFGGRNREALQSECALACGNAKRLTLDRVQRYYGTELPERLDREKQTLSRLTGWGLAEIDKMPGAVR